jgi:hypothetical protein
VSERERGRQAELRAKRIRWRGHSRSMSKASRNMDESLRKMNDQAAIKSSRRGKPEVAQELGGPAEFWLESLLSPIHPSARKVSSQ